MGRDCGQEGAGIKLCASHPGAVGQTPGMHPTFPLTLKTYPGHFSEGTLCGEGRMGGAAGAEEWDDHALLAEILDSHRIAGALFLRTTGHRLDDPVS